MKKTLFIAVAVMLASGIHTAAWANGGPYTTTLPVIGGIPTPLQSGSTDIYETINLLLGTTYANNAAVNPLQSVTQTITWQNYGATLTGGTALIGLSAANANTLMVYDVSTPGTKLDVLGHSFSGMGYLGDGTEANPYPGAAVPLTPGTEFGWSLGSIGHISKLWDSNPVNNIDGIDHLFVYHLSALAGKQVYIKNTFTNVIEPYTYADPYLLAWEDLNLADGGINSDQDYNDMMYVVDRVAPGVVPVPEPMTMALFGVGLVGMGAAAIRRKMSFPGIA